MGRKLHRKVPTKPKPSLPRIFECPRCEAEAVKIEMKEDPVSIATVMCGNCHISRTFTGLKRLHDKVDIFGMWVDLFYEELEKGEISEDFESEIEKSEENDNSQTNGSEKEEP
jgi:transcription elongation factor Elf1